MRIAYFTDTYLPQVNGVTNTLSRLVHYLNQKQIDNLIFAPGEESIQHETAVDTSFSFRFFLYPECRLSFPNLFRIRNVLDRFKPDLIHCVTPFNLGLCGLKYAKDHQIPFVASYHTNFDQYLDYYNLKFLHNLIWEYMVWFHNQCLVNFAPSEDTLTILKKKGITNTELWSRGVDTQFFHPSKRKLALRESWGANDKLVILYVGRLAPEKNLQQLITSFKFLQKKYPQKIHLVITGDGPMDCALKQENLKDVTFTGYKKGEELAEIYASSDIFAFPSCTETFGNVVLEAMASGLAVLGMASGGVKEIINHGHNGLLADVDQINNFQEMLEIFLVNQDMRIHFGEQARRYALSRNWEKVFVRLLESYEKCLTIPRNLHRSA